MDNGDYWLTLAWADAGSLSDNHVGQLAGFYLFDKGVLNKLGPTSYAAGAEVNLDLNFLGTLGQFILCRLSVFIEIID
jgi:hypothetical protein